MKSCAILATILILAAQTVFAQAAFAQTAFARSRIADPPERLAQAFGVGRAIGGMRAATIGPGAGPSTKLILLRDRSDYASTMEMIEKETTLIDRQARALRASNDQLDAEVDRVRASIDALEEDRRAAERSKARRLRERVRLETRDSKDRLDAVERELATTKHLRETAIDEGGEVSKWRETEERLRSERDRLRKLLEKLTQLHSAAG